MQQCIILREGYSFIFEEQLRKINIVGLSYRDILMLEGWMEITDFIAILECALKNKLGTKRNYAVGDNITMYGTYKDEFIVNIEMDFPYIHIKYNLVEVQQLVSKLNKLLHTANKLYKAVSIEESY